MKKNRSSYFHEQTDYMQGGINPQMMQQPNMMSANNPYPPQMEAQSSFSVGMGPNMAMPMNPNMGMQPNANTPMPNMALGQNNINYSDIESRLAKMERQINRLEHRVSKLETNNTLSTEDFESNVNNMYMV